VRPVVVRPDPGELADPQRCPDEPMMPAAVYTDDKIGAAWNSQVLDAGRKCRSAFRDLIRFTKGTRPN
jgi:hypothetical protein